MSKNNYLRVSLKVDHPKIRCEVMLAEQGERPDIFFLRSIPAFTYGVAYGDSIALLDTSSGEYRVVTRSGQVTIRLFAKGSLERPEIRPLIDQIIALNGLFEVGKQSLDSSSTSLLLISLDISLGFEIIEKMLSVPEKCGDHWEYGNIYDENGAPLSWWTGREFNHTQNS